VAGAVSAPADPHWLPMRIQWTPSGPAVDWCHLGDLRFTDPFFAQTVAAAMDHPFNLLFRCTSALDALPIPQTPELRPAGFIFHMSRCGSTLVTQMLAALASNVVLSEPKPIDQILRVPSRWPGIYSDRLVLWLRALVAALGRHRGATERDLFVKFEGWHALLLPLIRRAFPHVPWIFLYREPLEVLVPMAEQFPADIEPALFGLSWPQAQAMSTAAYCALVLEYICRAAIAQHGDGGLLIEYRELPEAACGPMLDHFGLRCGPEELARMRQTACFDAKRPKTLFTPDAAEKRSAASVELVELASTRLSPLYRELEALRRGVKPPGPPGPQRQNSAPP
jgi:hypothetical protein